MIYVKDGKNFSTPIKIHDGNKVIFTNNHEAILKAGYKVLEKQAPIKMPKRTMEDILKSSRFSKLKVKEALVKLNLWENVKGQLTPDEYEDLMIADDLSFDNAIFVKFYNILKEQIKNIDKILIKCRKH
jgi:hypothetical protein